MKPLDPFWILIHDPTTFSSKVIRPSAVGVGNSGVTTSPADPASRGTLGGSKIGLKHGKCSNLLGGWTTAAFVVC